MYQLASKVQSYQELRLAAVRKLQRHIRLKFKTKSSRLLPALFRMRFQLALLVSFWGVCINAAPVAMPKENVRLTWNTCSRPIWCWKISDTLRSLPYRLLLTFEFMLLPIHRVGLHLRTATHTIIRYTPEHRGEKFHHKHRDGP